MRKPFVVLVLLGLGLSGISYAEGVYRWEKDGKVFYSDQPPPSVDVRPVDTNVPTNKPASDNEPSEQDRQRQAVQSQECDKARARLVEYQNSPILRQRNLKGEERELTSSERIDIIVRAQSDVNELCGPPAPEEESAVEEPEEPIELPEFDEGADEDTLDEPILDETDPDLNDS